MECLPEDHLSLQGSEAIRYQRRTRQEVANGEKTTPRGVGKKTLLVHSVAVPGTNTMLLFFIISVKNEMPEHRPGFMIFFKIELQYYGYIL